MEQTKRNWWPLVIVGVLIVIVVILAVLPKNSLPKENIKIGAVLPLSGVGAYTGIEMKKGMEMCNPGNINFVFEDSFSTPQQGISAYNKITKIDKVDVSILSISQVVAAILPIAKENKDFVIASGVTAADVGKNGGDTVFRYFVDGYVAAKFIAKSMFQKDVQSIGLIYLQDEFGMTYKKGLEDSAKDAGVTVYAEAIRQTDVDFSTIVTKLKEKGIQSILVVAYDKQTLQAVKQVKEFNLNIPIFTGWMMWMMADGRLQKGTESLLDSVYFPSPSFFLQGNEKAKMFNKNYSEKYGLGSNIFAAIGCDLSILIGENNLNNYQKLLNLKSFEGTNGKMVQEEYGEFYLPLKMVRFVDGNLEVIK